MAFPEWPRREQHHLESALAGEAQPTAASRPLLELANDLRSAAADSPAPSRTEEARARLLGAVRSRSRTARGPVLAPGIRVSAASLAAATGLGVLAAGAATGTDPIRLVTQKTTTLPEFIVGKDAQQTRMLQGTVVAVSPDGALLTVRSAEGRIDIDVTGLRTGEPYPAEALVKGAAVEVEVYERDGERPRAAAISVRPPGYNRAAPSRPAPGSDRPSSAPIGDRPALPGTADVRPPLTEDTAYRPHRPQSEDPGTTGVVAPAAEATTASRPVATRTPLPPPGATPTSSTLSGTEASATTPKRPTAEPARPTVTPSPAPSIGATVASGEPAASTGSADGSSSGQRETSTRPMPTPTSAVDDDSSGTSAAAAEEDADSATIDADAPGPGPTRASEDTKALETEETSSSDQDGHEVRSSSP